MPQADCHLLSAVARIVLRGDLGDLGPQLDRKAPWLSPAEVVPSSRTLRPPKSAATPIAVGPRLMENGIGGFAPDGREYVIALEGDRETPLPWSNVLANPEFGTILTASGAAYTWSGNSRENRLTPFANDPITDPTGEAIFIRDEHDGTVWGATPGPLPRAADCGRWVVRHGAGVTHFQHAVDGLEQDLAVCVAPDDPVKLSLLTLTNTSAETRQLSVFGYVEWVLGPPRAGERRFVISERDEATGAMLARNPYNTDYKDRVAFWHATEPAHSVTGDRADFIGRNRTLATPAALLRETLGGRLGAGLDPCAALQIAVSIPPGESRRIAFGAGSGERTRRTRSSSRGSLLATRGSGRCHSTVRTILGRCARDDSVHAGRFLRSAGQSLAAVPGVELPNLGPQRTVSTRWRVWLPRSTAGRAVAPLRTAGLVPRASAACGLAPVRRRRRPALVASAVRARHPHSLLGRSAVAAVRGCRVHRAHRTPAC